MPAFFAEEEVAYNGNIIIKFDGFFARGTEGVRFYNRFTARYPVYADIEKAADDGAEYENYYRDQVVHLPLHVTLFV